MGQINTNSVGTMSKTTVSNAEATTSTDSQAPTDISVPDSSADAIISTNTQDSAVQSNDNTATKEVISAKAIPYEYRFNQDTIMKNMSAAISSDINDIEESELLNDETFAAASILVNNALYGTEFTGSNQEAAQMGIDTMRKVNNILINPSQESMLTFANVVQGMSHEAAVASLYMLDMFDAKNSTMKGFIEAVGYMGYDASSYIGISSLGWGFAGREAARVAAKESMFKILKDKIMSNAGQGMIEGAAYTGAFEHGKQKVSEAADQGYDTDAVVTNTIVGSGVGAGVGKAADIVQKVMK